MGKIYWNLHSVGFIPGIDVINVQNVARPLLRVLVLMATLSSNLAWKILQGAWWSTVHGDTRVRHDLVTRPQQASS